mmetsp:Transcript_1096/g.2383  ORF Transcript_1096/g.2383 Transcript_1096/m.2383 type:complete len:227 (+) Transcript_1096:852-1532(+)
MASRTLDLMPSAPMMRSNVSDTPPSANRSWAPPPPPPGTAVTPATSRPSDSEAAGSSSASARSRSARMTVPHSSPPSVAATSVAAAAASSRMRRGMSMSMSCVRSPETRRARTFFMGLFRVRNMSRRPSLSSTAAPPLRLKAAPSAGRISGNLSNTVTSAMPKYRSASAVVSPQGPAPMTAIFSLGTSEEEDDAIARVVVGLPRLRLAVFPLCTPPCNLPPPLLIG